MTETSLTCPKCSSPVPPGRKFCENCGAKIEAPPACPQCGTQLAPGVKFCENCGKPVAADAAAPEKEPAAEAETPAGAAKKPKPVPEAKPQAPAKAPAPAAGDTTKKPFPTLIIAAVVVLAILGAAVWLFVLPALSGGSASPAGNAAPPPASPGQAAGGTPAAQQAAASGVQASFAVDPTQIPPANLLVLLSATRDPITGLVTVTFDGGAGRNGVRDVSIRLTRSDGQVIDKTVTFQDIGPIATLEGTKTGDDRIEATANYYNGNHYKIIDQILEYKRRNW